jgi:hypothetical protein
MSLTMAYGFQVVFDCSDPARLAAFWASALGYHVQPPPDGFEDWATFLRSIGWAEEELDKASAVVDPDGSGPRIFFQRVPESKVVKNRVHLDINVSRTAPPGAGRAKVDAEVERLIGEGATKLRAMEELGEYWTVMQDPEGNEFCVQ